MLASIFLLSVSLSIDALGMGATYGLRDIRIPLPAKLIISVQSIIITSLSLICGKWLSVLFTPSISKIIGVLILILLGCWILWQGLFKKEKEGRESIKEDTVYNLLIKSMGITIQIIRTPQSCDMDNSSSIEPLEALYLGFALSFDSFGAGLGSGAAGILSPAIPLLVALCQALFLTIGHLFGKKIALFTNLSNKIWVVLSGTLLIVIGLLRLL